MMAHIHTRPGQHDLTVSAYILRKENGEWKCLVHMHKKLGKLLQVGGHVELAETPWQALAHELREEAGYELGDLQVLQPNTVSFASTHYIMHPVPMSVNTHKFSVEHYHTDLAYGFIAQKVPSQEPLEGESADLRWLSVREMETAKANHEIIHDVVETYDTLIRQCAETYAATPAESFSLEHPQVVPANQD